MKKQFYFFLLLICTYNVVFTQDVAPITMPSQETLEGLLEEHQVPAIGIGIINNAKIDQIKVVGTLSADQAAYDSALFDVASLTKSITTLLTLQLVAKGQWDLDAPLSPYWIDPDVQQDPNHKKLTTRHILSHSSGFKNWRWMSEDKKLSFDFEPGTQLGYSGEGFEYLRKALEKKFQKSFEELCATYVFQAYGMKDSHLTWKGPDFSRRFAQQHDKEGKPYQGLNSETPNAADNLLTSIGDMLHFGQAVLQQKGLNQDLFDEMIYPYFEMKPKVQMGLSWVIFPELPGEEYALFNAGSDQGVNAIILLLPKSKRGLVLFTNGDNGRGPIFKLIGQMLNVGPTILQRL